MTIERMLRLLAGIYLLASLALAHYVSPYWLLFSAFIGVNLLQSGLTSWCPMMSILRKLGVPAMVAAKVQAPMQQAACCCSTPQTQRRNR